MRYVTFLINKKKSRDKTVCTICNSNDVEDEYHFLFFCEKYNDLRSIMFNKIKMQRTGFESKDFNEKLEILSDCPILLGNYVQKTFLQHQLLLYDK